MFLKTKIMKSTENFFVKTQNTKSIQKKQDLYGCKYIGKLQRLAEAVNNADAVIIGAGAGLSTSAGFTYSGERFEKYFADFEKNMIFTICIRADFIRMTRLRSIGHIGADIFT